ncbi:PTHB1_N-terminus-containing protein [Hexamita inflata]|uniref:PTHB1 N-terminus-containing protein n=1 Tax=Hexamita inflata TaxID=28002 RepID=A0AA86PV69_9EUKA|nr:PTHB1 N-terminus-containing protein [Hexamita inflata]
MYNLRTIWEHKQNKPLDIGCVALANVMRTKNNSAQLIVGLLSGEIQIFRFSPQFQHQDLLAQVQTNNPVLGLLIGSFSGPYIVSPDEQQEKIEIAVIHPNMVSVYAPKRQSTGDVTIGLLYSIDLSQHPGSFTVLHRKSIVLDENKNKRLSIQSMIAVKSIQAQLVLINCRQIVAKITLSQRYALPAPMSYNHLTDQLIISTFEYEVIAINLSQLLQNQNEQNPKIIPSWNFCLNDRIQQLECGRFFSSDSQKNGEILCVLPRQILYFNDEGKLLKELKFEQQIISVANVYPAKVNSKGKHPVVVSQLVLLLSGVVILINNGQVRWKGVSTNQINPLEFERFSEYQIRSSEDPNGKTPSTQPNVISQDSAKAILGEDFQRPDLPKKVQPLKAQPLKAPQIQDQPWPIQISSPINLGSLFTGNAAVPQCVPQYPGLFLLADSQSNFQLCLFGIRLDQQNLKPVAIPSTQASKELKDQLIKELDELRSQQDVQLDEVIKIDVKISGIKMEGDYIITSFALQLQANQHVIDCIVGTVSQANFEVKFAGQSGSGQSGYIKEMNGFGQIYKMNVDLLVKKGQFVSQQKIFFAASGQTTDTRGAAIRTRTERQIVLPLVSYCVFDAIDVQQQKYIINLELSKPVTSLSSIFGQKYAGILSKLQNNQRFAIIQPNGQSVTMQMTSQFSLQLQSSYYETFYAAFDFIQQFELEFNIKTNIEEFAKYFTAFLQQKQQLQQQLIQQEDFLVKQIQQFTTLNEQISQQFFTQQNPVLTFTLNNNFTDVAEHVNTFQVYLKFLMKKIETLQQEVANFDQKLKAMLCLVSSIKTRDGDEQIRLRDIMCYTDTEQVAEVIQEVAGKQCGVEQAIKLACE